MGLEMGLPDMGGPAQLVRSYRGLQEKVLVLEEEVREGGRKGEGV